MQLKHELDVDPPTAVEYRPAEQLMHDVAPVVTA